MSKVIDGPVSRKVTNPPRERRLSACPALRRNRRDEMTCNIVAIIRSANINKTLDIKGSVLLSARRFQGLGTLSLIAVDDSDLSTPSSIGFVRVGGIEFE